MMNAERKPSLCASCAAAPPWRSSVVQTRKNAFVLGCAVRRLARVVALGQQRTRRRWADLHDPRVVGHRDLAPWRRWSYRARRCASTGWIGDERLDVLHALCRIVHALHGVVERDGRRA